MSEPTTATAEETPTAGEKAPQPEEKEVLCTLCGLRSCWTGGRESS